jgi:intracellular sulfur oxidation DsrE/DsrF family protein
MQDKNNRHTSRRNFLGALATGTAAVSMASIAAPLSAGAKTISEELPDPGNPDELFKNIKGKHRVVFDATQPHGVYPFVWPRVFLLTNSATGTPEKDNSVVVVLRHNAIPYAFEEHLWAKYKFGELFKADDPATKTHAVRNPFWKPNKGDFKIPGIGEVAIGINELQDSGVMFLVCDAAITVYSAVVAQQMNMDAAEVKKDWIAGLLPNIHPVPSGVWALGRAQEKGCAYIFAG